ncbi:MAG: anaerobic glycerol-3-phosphate dehydrogenase subunit GlpA [Anaerolineales bacterium]|nr:anaerobic glycerol-3-phosphate dehydrogenase subunit GlpA [Anaerolineales bacterium]
MSSLSTQVLVIGGGATGLGIAWDAALRGLKVVLIEQSDIAQGTSGRHHGLLHSGGRYVLSDPVSARDCASENKILKQIAAHTIEDTGGLFVATPADPVDYPDRWLSACSQLNVPAEEISLSSMLVREPLLNPRISRSFLVQDASIDSFDLAHALVKGIREHGGVVLLRHRLESLIRHQDRLVEAKIRNVSNGKSQRLSASIFINAAGPWAKTIAAMAGIEMPLALGKGTLVAMSHRLVNTVVNRCKPPSDGDIIVPVGTVSILGTTDVPVKEPTSLDIEPWEVDLLLAEGDLLLPGLRDSRPLRTWAGIRPLYQPSENGNSQTRALLRAHVVLDHEGTDGLQGFISVIGGKLTTYRLMAEETVDRICNKLEIEQKCSTASTPLLHESRQSYSLPSRLEKLERHAHRASTDQLICECELVMRSDLELVLEKSITATDLDDLRRDLRMGMGPCQAGFCAYRTFAISSELSATPLSLKGLHDFLYERWKGIRPVAWGNTLQQMEFSRRIYLDLLAADQITEERS